MSSSSSTLISCSADRSLIMDSETHKAWALPSISSSCQTWNPASGSSVHTGGDTGQPWRSIQAETAPTVSGGTVGAVRMTSDGSRLFQGTMRRMPGQQPSPQLRFSEWFLWSATGVGSVKAAFRFPSGICAGPRGSGVAAGECPSAGRRLPWTSQLPSAALPVFASRDR